MADDAGLQYSLLKYYFYSIALSFRKMFQIQPEVWR